MFLHFKIKSILLISPFSKIKYMNTFADRVLQFHLNLHLDTDLPPNIKVLDPYQKENKAFELYDQFLHRFMDDNNKRKLIAGINPGRLGAGTTGIPFTDTKRLETDCGIFQSELATHEPSSVFVYDVIRAMGGAKKFYQKFYINSVCPLGFVRLNKKGSWVNYNYYDDKSFYKKVKPFIVDSLKQQVDLGIDTSVCFSLGKKNAQFLEEINSSEKLFEKVIALPHPRYIVQYKSKEKNRFITEYQETLLK